MAKPSHADLMKTLTESADSDKGFLGSLMDNPLFGAGVGVAGLGLGVTALRRAGLSGLLWAQRYFTTSLEIPSKDRSYHWVLQWINTHTKGSTQHIGVETRVTQHDNGSHTTSFDFVPSPGRHYIWFKRNLIQVEREREKSMIDLNSGSPWETVKLTQFGRNRDVFTDLLQEAKQQAMQKEDGKVVVFMPMMTDWRPFGRPRPKRPLPSVILDEGLAEHLEMDIKEFHKAGKWYQQRGIPHRRGYLLYGPPGSGKTSFIQALAGDMGHNICILNLNDRGLTDDRLLHLMTEVPPRSFVLLEDIDAVFNKRETAYSVTFSGLLNALDGVTSVDERIVFMTTNHIDRLDPALIRPGRVDCKVYVGDSTPFQQRTMFKQFYPQYRPEEEESAIASGEVSFLTGLKLATKAPKTFASTIPVSVEDEVAPVSKQAEEFQKKSQTVTRQQQYDDDDSDVEREPEPEIDYLALSRERAEKEARAESESQILADQFVYALRDVNVSMAELQGLMMIYKDQPRGCIKAAQVIREEKLSQAAASKVQMVDSA